MKKEYTIEQVADVDRWFYHFKDKNSKGEKIVFELSKTVTEPDDKKSLPYLWYKHGWINRILTSYWCVSTYIRDEEGNCIGKYNPTHSKDGKVDFDWMLEATEENKQRLIDEIIRRAYEEE